MARLYACPFCRQLFAEGEVRECPECELAVAPLEELSESYEARLVEPPEPTPPEHERLPPTYAGRMRGVLLVLALLGIGVTFTPWLHEYAPEIRVLDGIQFARQLPWLWAAPVAWFIMLALVLSRRTVHQMRGARLAVALLAVMVLMTVALRIGLRPEAGSLVPRRYEWGWGLYASGLLALAALVAGARFGGSLPRPPASKAPRPDA